MSTTIAASASLWDIKQHVKHLCPKRLSETRWGCFVESIKAVQLHGSDFPAALAEAGITTSDDNIKSEIISIGQRVTKFEFDLSLIGAIFFVKRKHCW
jgi:hypothetical protein